MPVSQLVVDIQRHRSGVLAEELLRHQLTVLLLRIALLPGGATPDETGAYARFRRAVEEDFARTWRVEEYAERMGYSVRTITRACLNATGRSAKQVIDDRVTLEAKRLLAAADAPIADIGRRLGFPEPTNFGRFFHREVGMCPGAFRQAQRAVPGRAGRRHRVVPARRVAPGLPHLPRARAGDVQPVLLPAAAALAVGGAAGRRTGGTARTRPRSPPGRPAGGRPMSVRV